MAQLKDTLVQGSLRVTDTTYTEDLVIQGSKTKNWVLATPSSADGAPIFRGLDATDIPGLAASKITSGILPIARGGTGTDDAPTKGGIIYASSTTAYASTGAGTSGQLLQSNAANAPSWITATNANTASTIVKRDASGNFSAGTITAALSGNASTATTLKTAREIYVDLGTTRDTNSKVTFNGSADKAIHVSGILNTEHGGTGVNSHTQNRLVWSNGAETIQATDNHYASATKIAINSADEPDENLYVNGSAKISNTTYINGSLYEKKSTPIIILADTNSSRTDNTFRMNLTIAEDGKQGLWSSGYSNNTKTTYTENNKWILYRSTDGSSYLTGSVHIIGAAGDNPLIVRGISGCDSEGIRGTTVDQAEQGLYLNINGGPIILGYANDNTNNLIDIRYTQDSTSSVTGALKVAGGVGIAKNLNVGGDLTISKSAPIMTIQGTGSTEVIFTLERNNGTNIISSWRFKNTSGTLTLQNNWTTGIYFDVMKFNHTSGNITVSKGILTISNNTDTSSISTGALVVTGGIGIGATLKVGHFTIGGAQNTDAGKSIASNTTMFLKTTASSSIIFCTNSAERGRFNPSGMFEVNSTATQSTHRLLVNGKSAFVDGIAFTNNADTLTEYALITYNTTNKLLNITAQSGTTIEAKLPHNKMITGTGTAAVAYVAASGDTPATNGKPALWKFNLGIATPTDGMTITITIPIAGHNNGVFVSLDNGTTYKPVSVVGTARLTTHYPVNHMLTLIYDADGQTNTVYPVAGATATSNVTGGCWRVANYYDSGNDMGIRVYNQTSGYNADYPFLVSRTALSTQIGTKNSNSSYSNAIYGVIWDSPNDGTHNKTPTVNINTGMVKLAYLTIQGTTASSSTTTGALVVKGGVGIAGKLYVGSSTSLGGQTTINYTTAASTTVKSGQLIVQSGTDSNSVALEFYRNSSASWQIINEGGTLKFRNNYTDAVQTTYVNTGFSLMYNTHLATFYNTVTIENNNSSSDVGFIVNNNRTTNPHKVGFMVGGSGSAGIYDFTKSRWLIHTTNTSTDTNVHLNTTIMSGKLTLLGNQYDGPDGNVGLDAANSDIIRVNGIYTSDKAELFSEGYLAYRSDTTWDAMAAKDGVFYFGSNVARDAALAGSATLEAGEIISRKDSGEGKLIATNSGNHKLYLYCNSDGRSGIYGYTTGGTGYTVFATAADATTSTFYGNVTGSSASCTGNAATATRINGNLAAATDNVLRNIVLGGNDGGGIGGDFKYGSGFYYNTSTKALTVPGPITAQYAGSLSITVNNSTQDHSISLTSNASGTVGLYDVTKSKWMLYNTSSNGLVLGTIDGADITTSGYNMTAKCTTTDLKAANNGGSNEQRGFFVSDKNGNGSIRLINIAHTNGYNYMYLQVRAFDGTTDRGYQGLTIAALKNGTISTSLVGSFSNSSMIYSSGGTSAIYHEVYNNYGDLFLYQHNSNNAGLYRNNYWNGSAKTASSGWLITTRTDGQVTSSFKIYGAVWNDYAEYRATEPTEPGRVVTETYDKLIITKERLMPGCRIVSDTFGFAIGQTELYDTPIAVSGRVLVYPYRSREEYSLGAAVCSAPNGTVDIMTRDEIMMYPERIIGTVSEIPTYDVWQAGSKESPNPVQVNGRIWIYVR